MFLLSATDFLTPVLSAKDLLTVVAPSRSSDIVLWRSVLEMLRKTGERQSRTAFIVQAVREKLARLEAEEADTIGWPANTARPQ